ncbi:uncharacterized protein [Amphiura filiformis]|uniref:uncharacterized protein isoform X2 n=1 Tax=Amphiura filiformis TaxID=82378 RepID=UPI003B228086
MFAFSFCYFISKLLSSNKEGVCSTEMTSSDIEGTLTWPETAFGDVAFSEETCGPNTDSGKEMPIGLRYCSPIFEDCVPEEEKRPQAPTNTSILEQCPENWHGYSGYCYFISKTNTNFDGARSVCSSYGSSLASIHNVGEQVFLQGLTKDVYSSLYIGLHDTLVEGTYQWTDETLYDYQNWAHDEPNNYGNKEDCILFYGKELRHLQGWWNDAQCSQRKWSICKKRASCNFTLGMESGSILDSQLSASSVWDSSHGPTRARLNQPREGFSRGAWTAGSHAQDQEQWIQVSFLSETIITAVVMQGRDDEDQWVTQYWVEYTRDGLTWSYISEAGSNNNKVFTANTDNTTPVTETVDEPVAVIAIRIRPKAWYNYISMRFELKGCIEKDNACVTDSRIGWTASNRVGSLDSSDWTFVIPGKEIPCDGVITHWDFFSKTSQPFLAIIWRPVSGQENQFKIVGINSIPALEKKQLVHYEVPAFDRFYTKKGDVLGFAFRTSLLALQVNSDDATRVLWFRNRDPYGMTGGEIYTFDGSGNRAYSLQAIVSPITNVSECATRKGRWGPVQLVPCNRGLHISDQEANTPSTTPPTSNETGYCDADWIAFEDYCYYMDAVQKMPYDEASNYCQILGGNLTSIHNLKEQSFHMEQFVDPIGEGLWIGLHDITNEGHFQWIDGSALNYIYWDPGQPDDWQNVGLGEDCAHLTTWGRWNDRACVASLGFICKKLQVNTCSAQQTDSEYGILSWPNTFAGEASFSFETCPDDTQLRGSPIAFRHCERNMLSNDIVGGANPQGVWQTVTILGCRKETKNATSQQLTETDIEAVARKLEHFTQLMGKADINDIHAVAWMVRNIALAESTSAKVLSSVTKAVNKLMDSVDARLNETESVGIAPSTSDIAQGLERQIKTTLLEQDKVEQVLSSLAVVGVKIRNNTTNPVRFSVFETAIQNNSIEFLDATVIQQKYDSDERALGTPAASIDLPVGVIPPEKANAGFLAYKDDFLFRSNLLMTNKLTVNGPIIGTTLEGSNLAQPVFIKIKGRIEKATNDKHLQKSVTPRCVFWDFQLWNGVGDWSEEGCQYVETKDDVIKCRCFHMSTFAVLQDTSTLKSARRTDSGALVMSPFIKLAISISLIAVGLTFILLVGFRQLRQCKDYHTFRNFCVAVFMLYLVFASGIDATTYSTSCISVAALLHYFTLVSLLWLAVEIRFAGEDIKAQNGTISALDQPKMLMKVYTLSWGLPLAVVAITMAISFDDYQNTKYCSIVVGPALFYGVVIPMAMIVFHNLVTFVSAVHVLKSRPFAFTSDDDTAEVGIFKQVQRVSQRLYSALAVSVIFTILICLEFLHLAEPQITAIKIVFAITLVITGLVIFGMFCIYMEEVRNVIVPGRCRRRSPEMGTPLSFQNMIYEPASDQEGSVKLVDDGN